MPVNRSYVLLKLMVTCLTAIGLTSCTTPKYQDTLDKASPEIRKLLSPLVPYFDNPTPLSPSQAEAIETEIQSKRPQFNQLQATMQNACYERFFVYLCLTPLQQEQRYWLAKLKQLEARTTSIKRQKNVEETRETIAKRLAIKPIDSKNSTAGEIKPSQEQLDQAKVEREKEMQRQQDAAQTFEEKQRRSLLKQKELEQKNIHSP